MQASAECPQRYEYIKFEEIEGTLTGSFININPWTQFFDLKGRTDKPLSLVENIHIENCRCDCEVFFNVSVDKAQYLLRDFVLENLYITVKNEENFFEAVENIKINNVIVEGEKR